MRSLTIQEEAAINAAHSDGCWLIEVGYSSPAVAFRATTYDRLVKWNGHEWRSMADILAVDAFKESAGLIVTSYKLTLPAVDTDQLAVALLPAKGTPVKIWEAHLDDDGDVIPDPQLIDEATLDRRRIKITGKTATVEAYIESENANWRMRRVRRWTDADQRAKYPDDTSLRFVSQMSQRTLLFPSREAQL